MLKLSPSRRSELAGCFPKVRSHFLGTERKYDALKHSLQMIKKGRNIYLRALAFQQLQEPFVLRPIGAANLDAASAGNIAEQRRSIEIFFGTKWFGGHCQLLVLPTAIATLEAVPCRHEEVESLALALNGRVQIETQ